MLEVDERRRQHEPNRPLGNPARFARRRASSEAFSHLSFMAGAGGFVVRFWNDDGTEWVSPALSCYDMGGAVGLGSSSTVR